MSAELSLQLSATLDDIVKLHDGLEAFAKQDGWTSKLEFEVKLVVEELFTNVVNYGECPGETVQIDFKSEPDRLTIELADGGKPFDPLVETPEADTSSAIEDRSIGGLGVHLVLTMMDEVSYRRDGPLNRLTLVKRREE
ncbi:MAG: ATP-binding protein [Rhodospirillaceae bacterium]|nr:ATP-binding protein [Rhodospirillaceae bacterium]